MTSSVKTMLLQRLAGNAVRQRIVGVGEDQRRANVSHHHLLHVDSMPDRSTAHRPEHACVG